jgi:hypothetical protein
MIAPSAPSAVMFASFVTLVLVEKVTSALVHRSPGLYSGKVALKDSDCDSCLISLSNASAWLEVLLIIPTRKFGF